MKTVVVEVLNSVDKFRVRCKEIGTGVVSIYKRGNYTVHKGDTFTVENGILQGKVSKKEVKIYYV